MNNSKIDHTIIIPTKNRPNWIKYCLLHYSNFNYSGKIMIIDDSTDLNFEKSSKIIKIFKDNLDIDHIKGENLYKERHRNVANVFSSFLRKIKTKYYSSSSDDDIIFTPNLDNLINFLEKNLDYSAVTAMHYIYDLDKDLNIKKLKKFKGNVCNFDDPLDRLICYANEKGLPHYGVIRTESRRSLWECEKKIGWPIFARKNNKGLENFDEELSWNAQIYIAGKIGNLNMMQYFRLNSPNMVRLENLASSKDENNHTLGTVGNIFDESMSPALKETFYEFSELINYEKTKYKKNEIDFTLKQILWRLIKPYDGAGLLREETDYKKQLDIKNKFKIKIKFNFHILFFLKFFNFFKIIIRDFYFKIVNYKIINNFKKSHYEYKIKVFEKNN